MANELAGRTAAFLVANEGIEQIELTEPWKAVEEAGGRTLTSWPSLRTDLRNAGATWVDEELVVDTEGPNALVTSRKPDDLKAFCGAIVGQFSGR